MARSVVQAAAGGISGTAAVTVVPGTDLLRSILPSAYGDGVSTMAGQDLPSAWAISNLLGAQSSELTDPRALSAFTYTWGQFLDHDLDLTPSGGTSVPIAAPTGDPLFDPSGIVLGVFDQFRIAGGE